MPTEFERKLIVDRTNKQAFIDLVANKVFIDTNTINWLAIHTGLPLYNRAIRVPNTGFPVSQRYPDE